MWIVLPKNLSMLIFHKRQTQHRTLCYQLHLTLLHTSVRQNRSFHLAVKSSVKVPGAQRSTIFKLFVIKLWCLE